MTSALLSSCELFRLEPKQPAIPVSREASWDGNKQDSGLILVDAERGALVTRRLVDRYNELIVLYGRDARNVPALDVGFGLRYAEPAVVAQHPGRGELFWMTQEALTKMIEMNQWHKMARTTPLDPSPKP